MDHRVRWKDSKSNWRNKMLEGNVLLLEVVSRTKDCGLLLTLQTLLVEALSDGVSELSGQEINLKFNLRILL